MRVYLLAIVTGLSALFGCKANCNVDLGKQQVHAKVNCEVVAGPAAECSVQQDVGTAEAEVCWDFKVTCESGATLTAPHTCLHVANGSTAKTTIPTDQLTMSGTCTGEKRATLGTITLNGQPSQL